MCGIGGIWTRDGGPAAHRELGRMMSAIAHRGPEGAAYGRLDRERLLLGFLRLGFTDGGTCQQPLYDETGTLALVYNGEIYDHPALREELRARGRRFRTRSDSEVIVQLYAEHGERFYEHLNGEFAFALWDGRRAELLLVRDRFGVKPLFYAHHRGALVFASEVKALHALDGLPVELDPAYWAGPGVGVAECAVTPFRGVRQVRPGHVLRVGRTSIREERWFEPRFAAARAAEPTLEEASRSVRAAMERAVARRLEGDPPIGLSLSSGIDSTIVGALAAAELRARGRTLTAFSVGYDDAPYDESAVAARTAASLGLRFERVRCTAASLADGFLDATYAVEVPTNSLSTTARIALTRAVRGAGLKALLSGEGSDELFGGYPYFGIEAILRARREGRDVSAALARFRRVEAASRGVFWDDVSDDGAASLFGHPSAYAVRLGRVARASRWLFSSGFRAAMGTASPWTSTEAELGPLELGARRPFDATRLVSRSVLGSLVIPSLGDRVEMASSLEGRAPYLDRDVVALAYRLPERHCVDVETGVRKLVLRRACADLLPQGHVAPPKHTRMAPSFSDLRRTPRGRELVEDLLAPRAIRGAGVFSPVFVRALHAAWRVLPDRTPRFDSLDALVGYVVSVQALHAVHVEDALGRRAGSTSLPLEEDRSPVAALATLGGAS